MRASTFLILVGLALGLAHPSASAQGVLGTPVFHNGSLDSNPAGSGDVDVFFVHGNLSLGPHRAEYSQLASHLVEYTYAPGPDTKMYNTSYVVNFTDVAWTSFRVLLNGADFAGWNFGNPVQSPHDNPVVDIGFGIAGLDDIGDQLIALNHPPLSQFSLLNSSITRFNDQGSGFRDAELIVTFGDPIDPGERFNLIYNVIPSPGVGPGSTGFTIQLTPVPEPATAALRGLAALFAVAPRRRRR